MEVSVEMGLECKGDSMNYQYSLNSDQDIQKIAEQNIRVRGVKDEPITYWFKMQAGYDVNTGAGLRILLKRDSRN